MTDKPKYTRKKVIYMHHDRKLRLLDYMKTEQATTDAAVELDIPLQTVWRYMREMQASGHVEKIGQSFYAKYKATGKRLVLDEPTNSKYNSGFTFLGVQF